MGRKAVGPVCCVMQLKEPSTIIIKRGVLPWCLLAWLAADCAPTLYKPLGVIDMLYKNLLK